MRDVIKVALISAIVFLIISVYANCYAQGSYDMDPEYYHENEKHSGNFIALSNMELRGTTLGKFCNFSFPNENHRSHDHTFVINDHDLIIYCFQRDFDNVLRLVSRRYGFFDDSFKYIIIEGKVYTKVESETSFPGCPVPLGAKK